MSNPAPLSFETYTSPKWHGVLSWFITCIYLGIFGGGTFYLMEVYSRTTGFDTWLFIQLLGAMAFSFITGLILTGLPSIALVYMIRALKWRRGWADIGAGLLIGFCFAALIVFADGFRLVNLKYGAFLIFFGGSAGFVYWRCRTWLQNRAERRWNKLVVSQF